MGYLERAFTTLYISCCPHTTRRCTTAIAGIMLDPLGAASGLVARVRFLSPIDRARALRGIAVFVLGVRIAAYIHQLIQLQMHWPDPDFFGRQSCQIRQGLAFLFRNVAPRNQGSWVH